MKIALVSQEYPPETAKGGLASQTYLKAHGMAERGHDVHVISQTSGPQRLEFRDGAVRVTRTPGFYHRMNISTQAAAWLTYSVEVAVLLAELQARENFDLVDFPEWGGEGYVYLLNRTPRTLPVAVVQLHGPLVMFAHAMQWPDTDSDFYRVGTEMESTCVRLADGVFSSSECSIEWCRKYYGLVRDNVPVIHTGVDTRHFAARPAEKEKRPTVIFVGRLSKNKGIEELVDACCALAADFPEIQLRILGNGPATIVQHIEEKAERAGHPQLLELCEFVTRDKLPEELSRAHVFAAPSIYEAGPGFVYLEAMACGLPVVGCSGSGLAEVIESGKTGLLVPPRNKEALSRAISRLLCDKGERERMGARARDFAKEEADSERCLNRLEAYYHDVYARTLKGARP
jgi:glycosyltransferase involved in cell wall biosynthesis